MPLDVEFNRSAIDINLKKGIPPFAALRAFEAVGRTRSLRRAAHALDVDHAVVSRHLRALELWTGVSLIDRSPAGVTLTEAGTRYHARISSVFQEINDATDELTHRDDPRRLHIWCVPGFAFQWLMARLGAYQAAHPGLDIELHPTDASPDFARFDADADIRYVPNYIGSPPPAANVRVMEVGSPAVRAVASPEYLARVPQFSAVGDLLRLNLLHEENRENWQAWFAANGVESESQIPGPRLWHAHLTVDAARRGQGVALANAFLLGDDLASGRLIDLGALIPGCVPVVLGTYVLNARADRWTSPRIAEFRRWLHGAASGEGRTLG